MKNENKSQVHCQWSWHKVSDITGLRDKFQDQ